MDGQRPFSFYGFPSESLLFPLKSGLFRYRFPFHPAPILPGSGLARKRWTGGNLYGAGDSGFSWASSCTGTNAYRLNFYYGTVYPHYNGKRAYGFQLRCLQE